MKKRLHFRRYEIYKVNVLKSGIRKNEDDRLWLQMGLQLLPSNPTNQETKKQRRDPFYPSCGGQKKINKKCFPFESRWTTAVINIIYCQETFWLWLDVCVFPQNPETRLRGGCYLGTTLTPPTDIQRAGQPTKKPNERKKKVKKKI